MFKLTFNKPSFHMFFEGEDINGIRLRVDQHGVSFLPVKESSGNDIVPLTNRGRGGLEAIVDGPEEGTLLKALINPYGNPFFTLVRAAEGWVSTVPFEPVGGSNEPPRFKPHVRVWPKEGARSIQGMSRFTGMELPQFVEQVRSAAERISSYNEQRRPGRPPKEVAEAQATMKLLADLAYEYLPEINQVRKAYDALGAFLERNHQRRMAEAGAPEGDDDGDGNGGAQAEPVTARDTARRPRATRKPISRTSVEVDPDTEQMAAAAAKKLGIEPRSPHAARRSKYRRRAG